MAFWEADSGKGAKDPLGQKDHEFLQSREEAVRTGPSGEVVPGRDVELGGNEPCEVARGMPRAQLRLEVERKRSSATATLPVTSRVSRELRAHGLIVPPAPGEACPGEATVSHLAPVCTPRDR